MLFNFFVINIKLKNWLNWLNDEYLLPIKGNITNNTNDNLYLLFFITFYYFVLLCWLNLEYLLPFTQIFDTLRYRSFLGFEHFVAFEFTVIVSFLILLILWLSRSYCCYSLFCTFIIRATYLYYYNLKISFFIIFCDSGFHWLIKRWVFVTNWREYY